MLVGVVFCLLIREVREEVLRVCPGCPLLRLLGFSDDLTLCALPADVVRVFG